MDGYDELSREEEELTPPSSEEDASRQPPQQGEADGEGSEEGSGEGPDEEEVPPRQPGADLYEWLQLFLGCVIGAVLLFNCVARLTRVDGPSMDDTLRDGEVMLIWSLGYAPKQGDIVVLNKTSVVLPGWNEPRAMWTVSAWKSPISKRRCTAPPSPPLNRPIGRSRRARSSSWGTIGTTPLTAGTTGWALWTPVMCWARWSSPCGRWTASA